MNQKLKVVCSLCEYEHNTATTVYFVGNKDGELMALCNDKLSCSLDFAKGFRVS